MNLFRIRAELTDKARKRLKRDKPDDLSVPISMNQLWSMHFMSDSLIDRLSIRTFNVIDDYNREGLDVTCDWCRIDLNRYQINWSHGPIIGRSHYYIFNLASRLKLHISKDLTERQDMNG